MWISVSSEHFARPLGAGFLVWGGVRCGSSYSFVVGVPRACVGFGSIGLSQFAVPEIDALYICNFTLVMPSRPLSSLLLNIKVFALPFPVLLFILICDPSLRRLEVYVVVSGRRRV